MDVPTGMEAWTKVEDRPGGFELRYHPVPVPGPGEVLVRTRSTSICGTDLHIWSWDEWSRSNVDLGTITGHETSGVIVALGQGVEELAVGDRIAVECHLACWSCPRCEEGNAHICDHGTIFGVHSHGAFAPYFTIPASNARPIPASMDPILASIQDPLGNAIHTLTGGPIEGATVAVHGLGPIGLFAVNAAKAMGAAQVIAVDWDNRFRMDLAMDLGADLVLGKSHDVVKSILEATEGRGVDNSCEFSGSPAALSNAIRSTRQGGWVNVLSVYGEASIPIPMNEVVFRYLHLKGINGRKMWSTWDRMHALLDSGAIDVERIVTHRLDWRTFPEAMEIVAQGECGKVILEFDDRGSDRVD